MYYAIVRRIVRNGFRALSVGDEDTYKLVSELQQRQEISR